MTQISSTSRSLELPPSEPLRQLLGQAFIEPTRADEDLRAAVCDYVRDAKARKNTPEKVLIVLKRTVADVAVARFSYRTMNDLTERVVRWCIDAYYDGAEGDRGLARTF
jgi:hypothetical protein